MCESSIEVINDNIKSKLRNILTNIEEISDILTVIEKISNSENIEPCDCHDELKIYNDDLTLSLKIIKRLKLLIKKLKRIKSITNEVKMYAYKPERITTDDEEE